MLIPLDHSRERRWLGPKAQLYHIGFQGGCPKTVDNSEFYPSPGSPSPGTTGLLVSPSQTQTKDHSNMDFKDISWFFKKICAFFWITNLIFIAKFSLNHPQYYVNTFILFLHTPLDFR